MADVDRNVRQRFFNARRRAIELGLIKKVRGGAGIAPLLKYEKGQFSRVPVAFLFDQTISRPDKRVFIALSLYSSGLGDSRPAVTTIAKASATHVRDVRRALRRLEDHCRITRMGAVGRGNMRYFVTGQAIPRAQKSGKTAHTNAESYPHNPPSIATETQPNHPQIATETQPKSPLRPRLTRVREKETREREEPVPVSSPAPRDEPQPPTKIQAKNSNARYGLDRPRGRFRQASKKRTAGEKAGG